MTDLLLKFVEELGSNESFWSSQNRGRKGGSEEKRLEAAISEVWLFWPTMRIAMKN